MPFSNRRGHSCDSVNFKGKIQWLSYENLTLCMLTLSIARAIILLGLLSLLCWIAHRASRHFVGQKVNPNIIFYPPG